MMDETKVIFQGNVWVLVAPTVSFKTKGRLVELEIPTGWTSRTSTWYSSPKNAGEAYAFLVRNFVWSLGSMTVIDGEDIFEQLLKEEGIGWFRRHYLMFTSLFFGGDLYTEITAFNFEINVRCVE